MKAITSSRIERRHAKSTVTTSAALQPSAQSSKTGRKIKRSVKSKACLSPSPSFPLAAPETVQRGSDCQAECDVSVPQPLVPDVGQTVVDIQTGRAGIGRIPSILSASDVGQAPGATQLTHADIARSPSLQERLQMLEIICIRRRQAVVADGNLLRQIKSFVRLLCAGEGKPIPPKKPVTAQHIKRFKDHIVLVQLSEARKQLLKWRNEEEKQIHRASEGLPTLDSFWLPIPGLAVIGFALIVSEAGDLSNYSNPAKLWKRFGLHVYEGKACGTWRRFGGLSADKWSDAGYSPRRRSVMFTVVDSLLMRKDNPYYELYLAFKEKERVTAAAAGLTVCPADEIPEGKGAQYRSIKHIDMRARRKIAKRLLLDFWRAWRNHSRPVVQNAVVSPCPPSLA